eukprot:3750880-Amphidinium_carterae.2
MALRRSLYLAKRGHSVVLMLPWIDMKDQVECCAAMLSLAKPKRHQQCCYARECVGLYKEDRTS